MAYTAERHGYQKPDKLPVAIRLIGDWKRSCTARANLRKATGEAGYGDIYDLAVLWRNLHNAETYLRIRWNGSYPADIPEWVLSETESAD